MEMTMGINGRWIRFGTDPVLHFIVTPLVDLNAVER
jgi:hypothetical protein